MSIDSGGVGGSHGKLTFCTRFALPQLLLLCGQQLSDFSLAKTSNRGKALKLPGLRAALALLAVVVWCRVTIVTDLAPRVRATWSFLGDIDSASRTIAWLDVRRRRDPHFTH
ncbi:hypothetical protein [Variovorax sp. OK605]|uniref:hypothetical protein n=1 Tax=Variovorax sp. OK605 TaxID=1855317 RepID=UPI0011601207|nr:hypothetical protein [Variovorax sp. OK605]